MPSTAALSRTPKTCPRCLTHFEADALFCPRDGARLEVRSEDGDADERDPYLGVVIAGDIEILSVAGVGAMGRVYRAHQRGIERDVAVKILHRELSSSNQLVSRFHREAKIASKLAHPHVVEVYLAGQLPDGALYTVMEFLDCASLAGVLTEHGAMPLHRTLSIALQICDAVGEGHARGIVHRDLKPENIMLVRRADVADWVKVLDFGIAKLTLGEQSMETQAGLIFGTARYISPEAAQGQKVGPPGDVYAIATMLYQLLSGRTPFDAEPLGLLVKHIHEAPPDLWSLGGKAAEVPAPIARLIMENLAKEPERRAPNGRALATLLAEAAREANVSFSDVGVVARMSRGPAEPAAQGRRTSSPALDPTLDDVAGVVASPLARPVALVPSPAAVIRRPQPSTPSDRPAALSASATTKESQPPSSARRPRSLVGILLAFLIGAALTAFLGYRFVVRPDQEQTAFRNRTRAALAEGRFISPPGDCVRDLVTTGLQRWPEDVQLRQIRSTAGQEMITMSIAARNVGDLVGARNLARDALALDATDNSALLMRAQTEDELEAALNGTAAKTGPPRLIFESPSIAKPGQPVVMTGKIVWGSVTPGTKLSNVKVTVHPNGKSSGSVPVTLSSIDPNALRATLTAPTEVGTYDVAFEANVAGTVVRAMRDFDVAP